MKKNDKVFCIKNMKNNFDDFVYIKGKTYILYNDSHVYGGGEYVYIQSEPGTTLNDFLGFFIGGEKQHFSDWDLFNEYFVNKQILRKQKLEKLNENCS